MSTVLLSPLTPKGPFISVQVLLEVDLRGLWG